MSYVGSHHFSPQVNDIADKVLLRRFVSTLVRRLRSQPYRVGAARLPPLYAAPLAHQAATCSLQIAIEQKLTCLR